MNPSPDRPVHISSNEGTASHRIKQRHHRLTCNNWLEGIESCLVWSRIDAKFAQVRKALIKAPAFLQIEHHPINIFQAACSAKMILIAACIDASFCSLSHQDLSFFEPAILDRARLSVSPNCIRAPTIPPDSPLRWHTAIVNALKRALYSSRTAQALRNLPLSGPAK